MALCLSRRSKTTAESPHQSGMDKINISMLDVSPRKLDPQLIPDVQSLVALRQQPFNVRLHDANKRSVRSHTGDDGVEDFANPLAHYHCSQPLRHFALNFSRRIFLECAVFGDTRQ